MQRYEVLIIGYGVIGKYIENILKSEEINLQYLDPNQNLYPDYHTNFDFAIICVPTNLIDKTIDISIVEKVISESSAKINIIKSTIPPGTTEYLKERYQKRIVFSPEFYGATRHSAIQHNFVILGGDKKDTQEVAELFKKVMTGYARIIQIDSRTAELSKLMQNSFLACKVVFCNEFYRIARSMGVDYNELRELWLLDKRINPSHTLVFADQSYYDSHCLNKDIPMLIESCKKYNPRFIKAILQNNERFKYA